MIGQESSWDFHGPVEERNWTNLKSCSPTDSVGAHAASVTFIICFLVCFGDFLFIDRLFMPFL